MSTIGARADGDYQRTYGDFWAELVEQPDGQLDRDKVMRELHDYHHVMDQVTQVYSEISGFSKPNTAAVYVIQAVEDRMEALRVATLRQVIADLEEWAAFAEQYRVEVDDPAGRAALPGGLHRQTAADLRWAAARLREEADSG